MATIVKTTEAAAIEKAPNYSWYVLGLLTLVYVLNFADRTLIYILFPLIKREMAFSDLELALIGPISFTLFYSFLGVPLGRLADRTIRKNMIAAGLAVWSLFSGLTGFAAGFWTLFLCRVMVGVGEATLGSAAISLISDYFPQRMRATVQAVFSSGIAIGGGLSFFVGGWIGQNLGWRWAFYLFGFPGLLISLFVLMLREEKRGASETSPAKYSTGDWTVLFKSKPLLMLYAGYALFGLASNSLSIWGPSFFSRVHGFTLVQIGFFAGILSVAAGLPGTVLGGVVSDRLRKRGRGGRMYFSSLCALLSIPLWLMLLYSGNVVLLILANLFLLAFALIWLGPAAADVADLAGPNLRGLAVSIYFFTVNIVAYGFGSLLIGRLNDWLGVAIAPGVMRYTLLICPLACALAALVLWRGGRAMAEEQ